MIRRVSTVFALLLLVCCFTGAARLLLASVAYAGVEPIDASPTGDQSTLARSLDLPDEGSWESEAYTLINAARIREGRPPLAWDPTLATVIRAHVEDVLERGYLGPLTAEDDERLADRLLQASVQGFERGVYWAENLSLDATVAGAHALDMLEPASRDGSLSANILDQRFSRVGISVLPRPDATLVIGVLFLP